MFLRAYLANYHDGIGGHTIDHTTSHFDANNLHKNERIRSGRRRTSVDSRVAALSIF